MRTFLGGEELVNHPAHAHARYVIDFGGASLDTVANRWPEALAIVRRRVKPYRDSIPDEAAKRHWWLFQRRRETIYQKFRAYDDGLAVCVTSPHLSVAEVRTDAVFSNTAIVFALRGGATFATLQSRVHEVWARFFASSMKDDLRYTPSDCFETFPLPPGHADAPALEAAGRAYHDHRARLMVARNEGMTPTYNRFHAQADDAGDIAELRRLHAAMDDAVLRAYGWDDLADAAGGWAAPVHLGEAGEDDHRYQGRLFWPARFRDELLAHLLRLNEERAAAERRA